MTFYLLNKAKQRQIIVTGDDIKYYSLLKLFIEINKS